MKKVFRMLIFSGLALYLTSVWNKGFILSGDWKAMIMLIIAVGLVYYIVVPISKIVLLPLNLLTLGLVSVLVYFLFFYFIVDKFSWAEVESWVFPGLTIGKLVLQKTNISHMINVVLSAISVSVIINLQEMLV